MHCAAMAGGNLYDVRCFCDYALACCALMVACTLAGPHLRKLLSGSSFVCQVYSAFCVKCGAFCVKCTVLFKYPAQRAGGNFLHQLGVWAPLNTCCTVLIVGLIYIC